MAKRDENLFDDVTAMADRIGLKGEEKRKYVHDHMSAGGYRRKQRELSMDDYEPDSDDEEEEESRFFQTANRKRTSASSRTTKKSGDDWE